MVVYFDWECLIDSVYCCWLLFCDVIVGLVWGCIGILFVDIGIIFGEVIVIVVDVK